jgi:hypothetical protein
MKFLLNFFIVIIIFYNMIGPFCFLYLKNKKYLIIFLNPMKLIIC